MERSNHYEAAFAAWLQSRRLPHIGVCESRRSWVAAQRRKNLDFIVPTAAGSWLVDVKGRRWPGGPVDRPKRSWENWATRADVVDALTWARTFGPHSMPLFVFAFWLQPGAVPPAGCGTWWHWHDRQYLLRGVPVAVYAAHMRPRSPKWDTVCLPAAVFAAQARPLHEFLSVCDSQVPASAEAGLAELAAAATGIRPRACV